MRFIGDVHGKFDKYVRLTSGVERSIQVGDFGAGFIDLPNVSTSHRFIRGNHDDLRVCAQSPNWIPDGTYENGIFFCGGAYSIDKHLRVPGVSWWEDEELSYVRMGEILTDYAEKKPRIVVTHDAPCTVFNPEKKSRTSVFLRFMLQAHEPELWIFGHWHRELNRQINGTRFICLPELAVLDVEL